MTDAPKSPMAIIEEMQEEIRNHKDNPLRSLTPPRLTSTEEQIKELIKELINNDDIVAEQIKELMNNDDIVAAITNRQIEDGKAVKYERGDILIARESLDLDIKSGRSFTAGRDYILNVLEPDTGLRVYTLRTDCGERINVTLEFMDDCFDKAEFVEGVDEYTPTYDEQKTANAFDDAMLIVGK